MNPKTNKENNPDRVVESRKLASAILKMPERAIHATGFERLDEMIVGVREGDLIIVSGLSGTGKSQLMVSMARQMEGLHPLFFSYEMPIYELLERFGEQLTSFYLPLLTTSGAPSWIEKIIKQTKEKHNTKVVFIDHLHYLIDTSTAANRNSSEIIGSLVRQLKQVAKANQVAIILACHVRRLPGKGARPTINDLRDSSNIGNEADVVLMLQRVGQKRSKGDDDEGILISNDAWLYIDKCRHFGGRLGRIRLTFSENGFYEEVKTEVESD